MAERFKGSHGHRTLSVSSVGLCGALATMMTQVQKSSRRDPVITGLLDSFRGVDCWTLSEVWAVEAANTGYVLMRRCC